MAASREVTYLNDFRGGLNLTDQTQNLTLGETSDCMNVVFNDRGGFGLRWGYTDVDTQTFLTKAHFIVAGYIGGADTVLIQSDAGKLASNTGLNWSETANVLTDDTTKHCYGALWDGDAYIVNGRTTAVVNAPKKWDGTTFTSLTQTFNDDYAAPTTGNMPKAKLIANHANHMWVANTLEGATSYPHRVRFSHNGYPESWATNDWFNVGPSDDGDPITALVPYREMLLVFKRLSVWAVYGTDMDTFTVQRISTVAGVNSPRGVDTNSGICYWWSTDGNLFAFNGSGVVPIGAKIKRPWDVGEFHQNGEYHQVVWARGLLYISLELVNEDEHRVFVYDPNLQAFTEFDMAIHCMIWWKRADDTDMVLFIGHDDHIYDHSDRTVYQDYPLGVATNIVGYYRTAWITGNETASRKRWRRARITTGATAECLLTVTVFHNFDETNASKAGSVALAAEASTAGVWDTGLWDTMMWGGSEEIYEFSRFLSGGNAHAIQFKFSSSNNTGRWWVDSIALPFRRKGVR